MVEVLIRNAEGRITTRRKDQNQKKRAERIAYLTARKKEWAQRQQKAATEQEHRARHQEYMRELWLKKQSL